MKNYIRLFPFKLTLFVLITALMLIFKIWILDSIVAPNLGFHKIGLVFDGIAGSIIASYFFYLIVVYLKDVSNQKHIYPHIIEWSDFIISDCKSQLKGISSKTNEKLSLDDIKVSDITEAFKKIHPNINAPGMMANGIQPDWLQYFNYHKLSTHDKVTKILAQIIYIDAELIKLITDIDENTHFLTLNYFPNAKLIGNENLESFASSFFDYCIYCQKLEAYLLKMRLKSRNK